MMNTINPLLTTATTVNMPSKYLFEQVCAVFPYPVLFVLSLEI
jgi:hypothetical protein